MRLAYNEKRKARGEEELDPLQFYSIVQPKVRFYPLSFCPFLCPHT